MFPWQMAKVWRIWDRNRGKAAKATIETKKMRCKQEGAQQNGTKKIEAKQQTTTITKFEKYNKNKEREEVEKSK